MANKSSLTCRSKSAWLCVRQSNLWRLSQWFGLPLSSHPSLFPRKVHANGHRMFIEVTTYICFRSLYTTRPYIEEADPMVMKMMALWGKPHGITISASVFYNKYPLYTRAIRSAYDGSRSCIAKAHTTFDISWPFEMHFTLNNRYWQMAETNRNQGLRWENENANIMAKAIGTGPGGQEESCLQFTHRYIDNQSCMKYLLEIHPKQYYHHLFQVAHSDCWGTNKEPSETRP